MSTISLSLAGGPSAAGYRRARGGQAFTGVFAVPSIAAPATAWGNASRMTKGDHPRPLVLQGGSTG